MYVKWGSHFSDPFNVKNGVRQGGVLSSTLFNIYVDELSIELTNCKKGCNINGMFVNHIMYADDSVLIAPSPNALQTLIYKCENFANDNGIIFNANKSKLMSIKPKKLKNLRIPCIFLDNTPLEMVENIKYLGVFLTSDFDDNADIQREMKAIYARGNMIIKNFKSCSVDVKTLLFKTYCTGLYATQLWSNFNKSTIDKIQVAYNTIFRYLMSVDRRASISETMIKNGIKHFKVLLRNYMYKFKLRLNNSSNVVIKTLLNTNLFFNSSLYLRWSQDLYTFNL
jgi:hypothetical protein